MLVNELARVQLSVPAEAAVAVGNLLTEEGGGVEERDHEISPSVPEGRAEFLVWVQIGEVERRVQQVQQLLDSLREMGIPVDPWTWRSEQVSPESWQEAYKRYFTVHRLGKFFVVKPSWEDYKPGPLDLMLEMDPGMAFGTGLHASTQLVIHCLERAARLLPPPQAVLDLGCGTGILSIAAARLWSNCRALAVDSDETAVAVCRQNVERNHLESRITVEQKSAARVEGRYGLVLANLSFEVLAELQPRLRKLLDDAGHLVLSGLLSEQAKAISRLYARDLTLEPEYTEELDGWQAVVLRVRG